MGPHHAYRVPQGRLAVVETGIVKMVTLCPTPIPVQRGLLLYTLYTFSTAGSFMLEPFTKLLCYRSYMSFRDQDPMSVFVQRVQGWMSVGYASVDYYVPEQYAYMLYMYDSAVRRLPGQDYIA
jgi:hypothetical protein